MATATHKLGKPLSLVSTNLTQTGELSAPWSHFKFREADGSNPLFDHLRWSPGVRLRAQARADHRAIRDVGCFSSSRLTAPWQRARPAFVADQQ